jgi:hypothetical protein
MPCIAAVDQQISVGGQARNYVVKEGRSLKATSGGLLLTAFLTTYFPTYVDYGFTSEMEAQLDEISGEEFWSLSFDGFMNHFWNAKTCGFLMNCEAGTLTPRDCSVHTGADTSRQCSLLDHTRVRSFGIYDGL